MIQPNLSLKWIRPDGRQRVLLGSDAMKNARETRPG